MHKIAGSSKLFGSDLVLSSDINIQRSKLRRSLFFVSRQVVHRLCADHTIYVTVADKNRSAYSNSGINASNGRYCKRSVRFNRGNDHSYLVHVGGNHDIFRCGGLAFLLGNNISERINTTLAVSRYLGQDKVPDSAFVSGRAVIGKSMGLTASQIRQDLFCFGGFGQQGYGYKVDLLKEEIGEILGISRGHTLIVLGTGNLGRAIIQNFRFSANGFDLLAAFDIDPRVVGTRIAGVPVRHTDELEAFIAGNRVDVALLTVPIAAAQRMGDRLAAAGVRGIWNFTNYELACARQDVIVESVHFSDSLLALSYMISQQEGVEEEL